MYFTERGHGRLELEASMMTLAESQLTLAALASLCAGERSAVDLLRQLLRPSEADAGREGALEAPRPGCNQNESVMLGAGRSSDG